MLEAAEHADNTFVTLTYSDDNLPPGGSLDPQAHRLWLDRLRKMVGYGKVRFYLVGEYGDLSERPHYHVALFGFPNCLFGETRVDTKKRPRSDCCRCCATIHESWGLGHVFLGGLEIKSAQYVAQYVTKKLTARGDERLKGRYPEFARSSRNGVGGIGAAAATRIAESLRTSKHSESIIDAPSTLRYGPKELPLGRYMKRKIRLALDRDVSEPKEAQLKRSRELLPVRHYAKTSEEVSVKKILQAQSKAKIASIEAKWQIFNKGKPTI